MRGLLLCGLLLLACGAAQAAIVDTLSGFSGGEEGWSGAIDGSLSASGGNSEQVDTQAGARAQWQGLRHRWRLLGGYARSSSGGEEIGEEAMGHLRHNLRLGPRWSTLGFVQLQHNPFQRLSRRLLLGAGLRLDAVRGERGTLSIGAAHMSEWEDIRDQADEGSTQRLSAFLLADLAVRQGVKLAATAFYQPRWSDWEDSRATASAELSVALVGTLALTVGGSLQHDARPPEGVDENDWALRTGLRYGL